jgi:four helix bundle protein
MSRDHRKLRVFIMADDLAVRVYQLTASFPSDERFGLRAQIRRAAVSAAANIVEGCARRSTREYASFLNIAFGSASEVRYLLSLAGRLKIMEVAPFDAIDSEYCALLGALHKLLQSVHGMPRSSEPP